MWILERLQCQYVAPLQHKRQTYSNTTNLGIIMFPKNCFASRSNSWIPFIYVASDVARALCIEGMYATSPSRQPPIPPALMLVVVEVVKLVIALVFVALNTRKVTLKYFHLFLIQRCVFVRTWNIFPGGISSIRLSLTPTYTLRLSWHTQHSVRDK